MTKNKWHKVVYLFGALTLALSLSMVPALPASGASVVTATAIPAEGFADPPLNAEIDVVVTGAEGDLTYQFEDWEYRQNGGDTYKYLDQYPLLFTAADIAALEIADIGPTSDADITVERTFSIPGWYQIGVHVLDDEDGDVSLSQELEIRVLGIIPEDIAFDVKGAQQKICVKGLLEDGDNGVYDIEWLLVSGADLDPADIKVKIPIDPGDVGPPIPNTVDANDPSTYRKVGWTEVYNGFTAQQWVQGFACIHLEAMKRGDIHIYARVSGDPLGGDHPNDGYLNVVLHTEKKWGELDHSVLDLDADEPGIQGPSEYVILTPTPTGEMERTLEDTVYATFLEVVDPQKVGDAIVHWWLFEDADLDDLLAETTDADEKAVLEKLIDEGYTNTQELIDELMDHLASQQGALDDNHWAAHGKYNMSWLADWMANLGYVGSSLREPFDAINFLAKDIVDGGLGLHADEVIFEWVDYMGDEWYYQNETEDSWPAEDRGKTQATLVVDADEVDPSQVQKVIIVALVSYPGSGDSKDDPFNGQNIVAIEKGKISATWGRMDLHPDFVADKTEAEVGEAVTFTNLTFGGRRPYRKAEWDFDGDGEPEITIEGTHGEVMASVTWAYDTAGTYSVAMAMTDKIGTTVWKEKPDYIVVRAEHVKIWNLPIGGETLIAPNPDVGRPFLTVVADCDKITVSTSAELWGIYYLDETTGEWLYYIPGFVDNTLTQLEPDEYYYVVVSAPCTLTIPQGT